MTARYEMYRDASNRLTLSLEPGDSSRPVPASMFIRILIDRFGAKPGSYWESPLGDAATQGFAIGSEPFELDTDNWMGLVIIAIRPSGEDTLRRIAEYLKEARVGEPLWKRVLGALRIGRR